jgi:hypothetical protein
MSWRSTSIENVQSLLSYTVRENSRANGVQFMRRVDTINGSNLGGHRTRGARCEAIVSVVMFSSSRVAAERVTTSGMAGARFISARLMLCATCAALRQMRKHVHIVEARRSRVGSIVPGARVSARNPPWKAPSERHDLRAPVRAPSSASAQPSTRVRNSGAIAPARGTGLRTRRRVRASGSAAA